MARENCTTKTIRVDEDGSLARNTDFTSLLLCHHITMDTTGGYSSFLNGKVERPHQTIAQLVRSMLINSGHPPDTWCYCAENAADIYRYTYHSAINKSPYEAWYSIKPSIAHLRVCGCVVYVKVPSPKKSEDRVTRGYFMGFTRSRLLVRWLDPSSRQVKHAFAVKFDEYCTPISPSDHIHPGSFLLSNPSSSTTLPEYTINVSDQPSFDGPLFQLHLALPPKGTPLGCILQTCSCYNLPFISHYTKGTLLATSLSKHGHTSSTFWVLSVNDQEFNTAESTAHYITSLQLPSQSRLILFILVHRHPATRSTYADNRAIFNQIKLFYHQDIPDTTPPSPSIVPTGLKVVSLPDCPMAPAHIGQLSSNPLASDWKEAVFDNYSKMQCTGTWSAPLLRSSIPPGKAILRPRISFHVKDTSTANTYGIRLILALAASLRLTLQVLDISSAFQNSIIFDPEE
jgi:hypothetical protein